MEMSLKKICNIAAGYSFRGKIPEIPNGGLISVQMKDISLLDGIHWDSCVKTEISNLKNADFLQLNDILFVARGNHNYAIVVDNLPPHTPVIAAPHFYVIRCYKQVLAKYLAWFINQRPTQNYFIQNREGTTTLSIRRAILENTPIAVPSHQQQISIIQLAETIKQEQRAAQQLIITGELLLNGIAYDLLKQHQ